MGDLQQPPGRGARRHRCGAVGQPDLERQGEGRTADSRDPADREGSDPRRDQGLEEGRAGRAGRRSARGGARGRLSHRDPVDAPGASRSERDPLYRRRRGSGRREGLHANPSLDRAAEHDVHRRLGRSDSGDAGGRAGRCDPLDRCTGSGRYRRCVGRRQRRMRSRARDRPGSTTPMSWCLKASPARRWERSFSRSTAPSSRKTG